MELNINEERFCRYYQAHVVREQAWYFVAIARSYEHVMFDRTLNPQTSVFEFFVPADMEVCFLNIMSHLIKLGVLDSLRSMDNRLMSPTEVV